MDIRQFVRTGCDLRIIALWKSAPSPPPAPDYAGAASATAAGNKENTIAAQQGSMVNQVTPYGSLKYSEDPTSRFSGGNPSYTANIDLTPAGQQILDQQNKLSTGLFSAQDNALGQVNKQGPLDVNDMQKLADKTYANYTARLDPQWKQASEMKDTELRNQGLTPGTEAYDNAMRDFNQSKNDAYQQASQAAINTMPQTYQLAAAQYSQPLNQLNALRTGSQVTNPQFMNTPAQQAAPGANLLGAAQAAGAYNTGLYNSQVDTANSFNGGLMKLGGALGGAWLGA